MRSVAQRHPSVEMFLDRDRATGQRAAKARLLDLPRAFADCDSVVFGDDAFRLHCEYPVQIRSARTPKGSRFLFCRHRELAVKDVDIALAQKSIGLFQRADSR